MKYLSLICLLPSFLFALTGPQQLHLNHSLGEILSQSIALNFPGNTQELWIAPIGKQASKIAVLGDYQGFANTLEADPAFAKTEFELITNVANVQAKNYDLILWNHYGPSLSSAELTFMEEAIEEGIPQVMGFLGTHLPEMLLKKQWQNLLEIDSVLPIGQIKPKALSNHWPAHRGLTQTPQHSYQSHSAFFSTTAQIVIQDSSSVAQTLWLPEKKILLSGERLDGWWLQSQQWLTQWILQLSNPLQSVLYQKISPSQKSLNTVLHLHQSEAREVSYRDTLLVRTAIDSLFIPITWEITKDTVGPLVDLINPTSSLFDDDTLLLHSLWSDPSGISNAKLFYSPDSSLNQNINMTINGDSLIAKIPPQKAGMLYFQIRASDNQSKQKTSLSPIFSLNIIDDDTLSPTISQVDFYPSGGASSFWLQVDFLDESGIYLKQKDSLNQNPIMQYSYQGKLGENSPQINLFPSQSHWESNGKLNLDSLNENFTYRFILWDGDLDHPQDNKKTTSENFVISKDDLQFLFSHRLEVKVTDAKGKALDGEVRSGAFSFPLIQGFAYLSVQDQDSLSLQIWSPNYTVKKRTWKKKNDLFLQDTLFRLGNINEDKKDIVDEKDLATFLEAYHQLDQLSDLGPLIKWNGSLLSEPDGKVDFQDLLAFAQIWNSTQNLPKTNPSLPRTVAKTRTKIKISKGLNTLIYSDNVLLEDTREMTQFQNCEDGFCALYLFSTSEREISVSGKGSLDIKNSANHLGYWITENSFLPPTWHLRLSDFAMDQETPIDIFNLLGSHMAKGRIKINATGIEYQGPSLVGPHFIVPSLE